MTEGVLSPNVYGVSVIPGLEEPVVEGRRLSIPSLQGWCSIVLVVTLTSYLSCIIVSHIPQLLTSLCAPSSSPSGSGSASHLVAKYAPHYRLAFTVLNEDAADGKAVIGWDVRNSISRQSSCLRLPFNKITVIHLLTIRASLFSSPPHLGPTQLHHREPSPVPCTLSV